MQFQLQKDLLKKTSKAAAISIFYLKQSSVPCGAN